MRKPVTTETMVPDGCTLVLSGPVRDERSTAYAEVPVLGQLPLFGKLFRTTTVTTRRSELLVLITPHVVYDRDAREIVGHNPSGNPAAMSPRSADSRVQYVRGLLADSEGRVAELGRHNPPNPQRTPTNDVQWASNYTTQEIDTPTPSLSLPAMPARP
jgi:Flp pilus assembly secretin CpaC